MEPMFELKSLARIIVWSLVAALFINFSIGALPFSTVEGDDQGIINGLEEMMRGTDGIPQFAYSPELQPGTYQILRLALGNTYFSASQTFCAASFIAACICILLTAFLGKRLLGIPSACPSQLP
jgi:hypothetical protein